MKHLNKEKVKKYTPHLFNKTLDIGIGWASGLLAFGLIARFFEKEGWSNLWGMWSDRIILNETVFNIGEWVLSGIIGYGVMVLVNKVIIPKIIKILKIKKDKNPESIK